MAITGVQLIYRLHDTIRLLIDYRSSPIPPDSYNFYWSSTSGGVYALFASGIKNQPDRNPSIRNKILFDFLGSSIAGWSNFQTNYIKMAPVTGVVIGAQEGPLDIPSREELIPYAEKSLVYGYDRVTDKFIAVAVDSDGKVLTV
jgi:hypothetical protein